MAQGSEALFREVQRVDNPLVWAFALLIAGLVGGVWALALFRQEVRGRPFGNLTRRRLRLLAPPLILTGAAIPILTASVSLTTEVRTDGVYVRLFPFHGSFRRLPFAGLESHEIRTYSGLREYGGWGIRRGRGGWAYTLSGDRGLQFRYATGDAFLIGTRQPEALLSAVAQRIGSAR